MYVAICDDEKVYIELLEEHLMRLRDTTYHDLRWKAFSSTERVLEFYQRNGNKFDILITDIEMGTVNGVDLANKIRNRDRDVIIFFLTGHQEYAIQCFRAEPMNFWIKPVSYELMYEDFKRACSRILQSQEYITLIENRQVQEVRYTDIIYLEKQDRKTIIHTKNYDYKTNKSLSDFQNDLDSKRFVRIYQTYLVNLRYITGFSGDGITLKGMKDALPVGRTYSEELKKKLVRYTERRLLGK